MKDIKIKDNSFRKINNRDLILSEKTNGNFNSGNETIEANTIDYGSDKVKATSNAIKNVTLNIGINTEKRLKNKITNLKSKDKETRIAKTNEINIKEVFKNSKNIFEQGKNLAIESTKYVKIRIKTGYNTLKKIVKTMFDTIKNLRTILVLGGTLAIIVILIICLIGFLTASIFGIFFSSDKSNNIRMSDCIRELNKEMDDKISLIENSNIYDEVEIVSNKASWKDILIVYTIKLSNGNNEYEVMSIDKAKKKILKKVFWDMNKITYEVTTERQINRNNILSLEGLSNDEEYKDKKILHIYINNISIEDMKDKYSFNADQIKQLNELSGEKYLSLWNSVIYGNISYNEFAGWKQYNKEWSSIKIGNTDYTVGNIGCLVTSISILIKKSNVDTKKIVPFNPGTFVLALNKNNGFSKTGSLQYTAISKVVPNFKYQGRINLYGKTRKEKYDEIKKYYGKGYYIVVEVKGATKGSQHWVAVDSIDINNIYIFDPGSNATSMWSKYSWNKTSQFIYFKVG